MTTTLNRIQDERLAAVLALGITVAGLVLANFVTAGSNGGVRPFVISAGVCAVLAAVLFTRVLPGVESARAAWILAGLALLSCVAFWSGLPFILGMGAVYVAARTRNTGATVVGLLAIVLAFIACAIG